MERNFIGQIKVKVNGELCDARVTDDGYLVFPNGREQKLSSDRFMAVIKKLKAEVEAAPQQPVQPEPVVQQPPVMTPPVQEPPYVQPQQRQYVEPAPVQQPVPEPVYNPQPMYVAEPAPTQVQQGRQQAPNEVIQAAEPKKNKKGKKEKPVKEKKQKGNAASVILALGLVAVILAFIAGIYSGIITINPMGSSMPNTGTIMNQEFDQEIPMDTDKVLIVARSVGADGTVKESILGYFDNASTGGSVFNGPNEPVNQNGGSASVEINAGDVVVDPVAPEANNGGQVVIQ